MTYTPSPTARCLGCSLPLVTHTAAQLGTCGRLYALFLLRLWVPFRRRA